MINRFDSLSINCRENYIINTMAMASIIISQEGLSPIVLPTGISLHMQIESIPDPVKSYNSIDC